jgi:hypothetical protein
MLSARITWPESRLDDNTARVVIPAGELHKPGIVNFEETHPENLACAGPLRG